MKVHLYRINQSVFRSKHSRRMLFSEEVGDATQEARAGVSFRFRRMTFLESPGKDASVYRKPFDLEFSVNRLDLVPKLCLGAEVRE